MATMNEGGEHDGGGQIDTERANIKPDEGNELAEEDTAVDKG
jgi:hypothetical protein